MKAHWTYLKYVLRHKWFVLIECWKEGLIWQGIAHDMSKFSRAEWNAYVDKFFRDKFPSSVVDTQFKMAWQHHFMNNPHHWDYWCHEEIVHRPGSIIEIEPVLMGYEEVLEMICDWRAMSRARSSKRVAERTWDWYIGQKANMKINPINQQQIELILLSDEENWKE